jgi:xanthine dehydrogenase large subunit
MKTIGKSHTHDSSELHVTGTAIYIDDIREPEGTVHVVPGFTKEAACGKILSCDLSAVRAAPGVIAVLTVKDIPHKNDCSPTIGDDPILADGHIEFHGQVIFAVVGESRASAK